MGWKDQSKNGKNAKQRIGKDCVQNDSANLQKFCSVKIVASGALLFPLLAESRRLTLKKVLGPQRLCNNPQVLSSISSSENA